ncbi:uncharacterized protein LOC116286648 [Actinia tenebrosa]|uniref:Uncharacterized protein LOC116286648 n=1 Tax=Actinia tenebrosa TaxID=6105 RepID=A0A6P8H9C5_ACTTE|nr:uncharacterized protein LOC116286648 [Actinia tenebrosa]
MFSCRALCLALILSSVVLLLEGIQNSCISDWIKMNHHDICFQGSGDRFGSFHNYVRSGLVAAIKLEHLSGHIACATGQAYNSYWGCTNHSDLVANPFNAVVTDQHNQVIFPKKNQILDMFLLSGIEFPSLTQPLPKKSSSPTLPSPSTSPSTSR